MTIARGLKKLATSYCPDSSTYINKVDECISDIAIVGEVYMELVYKLELEIPDLPIRRYMKSYSPRLVSSMNFLSSAWREC